MRKGQPGLRGESHHTYKHGGKGTRLYSIWKGIRKRCYNERSTRYKWYGGKGIKISEVWCEFIPFREWSLANGYAENLTIDRIDSDKDYSPENCRWITMQEQIRSKKGNNYISIEGTKKILDDWCKELGITRGIVYHRVKRKNLSFEECVKQFYYNQKTS